MECVGAPSPNFDERPKDTPIDILVMHYTGMETGGGRGRAALRSGGARQLALYGR